MKTPKLKSTKETPLRQALKAALRTETDPLLRQWLKRFLVGDKTQK